MKREDFVDFHLVAEPHLALHARLESWAHWVKVRPYGWQVAPMFRQYRSKSWQWERPVPKAAINTLEVVAMEKQVSRLPDKEREAVRWCYVFGGSPAAMARHLGVSKAGLMELVTVGRTMLLNRGA